MCTVSPFRTVLRVCVVITCFRWKDDIMYSRLRYLNNRDRTETTDNIGAYNKERNVNDR